MYFDLALMVFQAVWMVVAASLFLLNLFDAVICLKKLVIVIGAEVGRSGEFIMRFIKSRCWFSAASCEVTMVLSRSTSSEFN